MLGSLPGDGAAPVVFAGFSYFRSTTAGSSGSLARKCLYARTPSEATTIKSTAFDIVALYLLGHVTWPPS